MPGLGAFALAGAVGGFGDALVERANQRREDALLALKRRWDVDDREDRQRFDRENMELGWGREDDRIGRGADALESIYGGRGLGAAGPQGPTRTETSPDAGDPRRGAFSTGASGGGESRVNQVFHGLRARGIPDHIAAGLTGNIMQESGPNIDTGAVGDNGNAFGAAQWNGPRRREFLDFARKAGADPKDLQVQLDFLVWELKNSEKGAWAKIQKAETAEEAALIASKEFWRPGTPHNSRRAGYARQVWEVLADPNSSPQVRQAIAADMQRRGLGPTSPTEYSNITWRDNGDGTRTRIGVNQTTGQYEPVPGPDGKPVTESTSSEKKPKDRALSSDMSEVIDNWALDNGLAPEVTRKFKLEVERWKGEGMTETEAWDHVLAHANVSDETTETKDGWFRDSEVTVPGTYDGTFDYKDGVPDSTQGGQAPSPRRIDPPETPGVPRDPGTGLPEGVTEEQALQQARAAIAGGAPRAAVAARLRKLGINPDKI